MKVAPKENNGSTSDGDVTDQSAVDFKNESAAPLVKFLGSKQQDASIGEGDNGCDENCESFNPMDLLSFAWQIVKGMVGKIFISIVLLIFIHSTV